MQVLCGVVCSFVIELLMVLWCYFFIIFFVIKIIWDGLLLTTKPPVETET